MFCSSFHNLEIDTYMKILFVQLFAANMNTTIAIISTSNTRVQKMPTYNVVCWYLRGVSNPHPLKIVSRFMREGIVKFDVATDLRNAHGAFKRSCMPYIVFARTCRRLHWKSVFLRFIFRLIVKTIHELFPPSILTDHFDLLPFQFILYPISPCWACRVAVKSPTTGSSWLPKTYQNYKCWTCLGARALPMQLWSTSPVTWSDWSS